MPIAPRIEQHRNEIVILDGWEPDEEFPFGLLGAKAKRTFLCPTVPPHGFLIGGHRYLFKEPQGAKAQQVWSEVIAYEIGKLNGVEVPPAFLAVGPGNRSPGVLIEYFYGHAFDPERRLIHGIERLQARGFLTDLRCGSLSDNVEVCRSHRVPNAGAWWAHTLAFDALIGNTDRHSENWGFLVERAPDGRPIHIMAPAFDNGTSLGFIIGEKQLQKYASPDQLAAFINAGHHHFGWTSGDKPSGQHVALCARFVEAFPALRPVMRDTLQVADSDIDNLLNRCVDFPFPVPFTPARAEFVAAQIKARRDAVLVAIGV